MNRKVYIGMTALIIICIGVTAFLLGRNTNNEPKRVYIDVDPSMEMPPSEPGYKWVWHHDHWDKVPIAQKPVIDDVSKPAPLPDNDDVAQIDENEMDISDLQDLDLTKLNDLFPDVNIDYSNPKFTLWIQKYSKAVDDMMSTAKLSDETGGSTAKEFIENVDNMTESEKKELAKLLISRNKAYQNAVNEYIRINTDIPVK